MSHSKTSVSEKTRAEADPRYLRLFVVRHGQVAANREFRHVGTSDEPLTELGEEQALQLGSCLGELSLSAIYSSPLKRAAATAARIAQTTGLEVGVEERLAERSYGAWEGLSWEEIKDRGEEERDLLVRSQSELDAAPPGGESLLSVQNRVVGLVEELAARRAGEWIVLVTHVGPIKTLLAAALDLSLVQVRPFFLDPGTITVLDWGPRRILRLFNAHGHQGWTRARWLGTTAGR